MAKIDALDQRLKAIEDLLTDVRYNQEALRTRLTIVEGVVADMEEDMTQETMADRRKKRGKG